MMPPAGFQAGVLFAGVRQVRRRGWRPSWLVLSIVAHGLALLAFARLRQPAPAEAPAHAVPVRIVRPASRAMPPPPKGNPAPADKAKPKPRPDRLVQPTVIPDAPPEPGPPEPPAAADAGPTDSTAPGGVAGGRPDGVVGGVVGAPAVQAAAPMAARPADVATVRAGIARTLVYPPEARRRLWEGRTVLAFTLLADGAVEDLVVRVSSGFAILDAAAVEAIRRAAPFPPPGVDVLVVIPVAFRLR